MKALAPQARVFGVEPRGAAAMARSLEAGSPVQLDSVASVADGLKPVRPGDLTFEHARRLVDEVLLVDDEEILRALAWCADEFRLLVEPSGAAAVAAVMSGKVSESVPSVAVISGGNVDPAAWGNWVSEYGNVTSGTG